MVNLKAWCGMGSGWLVQLVPSQCSATAWPMAVHDVMDVQDTLVSWLTPTVWMVHAVPSQRSTSEVAVVPLAKYPPTAVHAAAEVQDTPPR